MAKIWPVYEGREPTIGEEPWAELSLEEAMSLFEVRPEDFVSDLASPPRFGHVARDLQYAGFKHIVVEIGQKEARQAKWKPGFYRSRVNPKEAFGRLIKQALAAELGNENIVRVEYEPTIDSRGRDALKITVVIAPGAAERVQGAVLDALVRLQHRLHAMRDDRTPIIQYATEAELAADASP